MIKVFDCFSINTNNDSPLVIEVHKYNGKYFSDSESLVNGYGLFFQDFQEFYNKDKGNVRVIDFLNDSVENNYMLCDSIQEKKFEIFDDHIYFYDEDKERLDYINMGEFYIDNYKVNVCSSYMFFEDLISGKSYIYYGD